MLADPEKMRDIAVEASNKSQERSGPLDKILDDVAALVRLVVAYARGTYRDVSGQSMTLILAGLIYLASPVDLIPDFIPVAGFTDDAAVLALIIRTVHGELEAFMNWETGQGGAFEPSPGN
ncbi:MAG TPA: YkvA family protein [Dehalococcoidia bacterium]|nr:YkvA family protein [Dehalococcoidia bacterium]